MSLYHKLLTVHPTTIKYLPWSECFYSGCVFIVTRTEVLGSSLLVRLLSTPKVPGSNPGISGWKEEILQSVFKLKRAHRAETGITNNELIPPSPTHGGHLSPAFRGGPIKSSSCLPPGLVTTQESKVLVIQTVQKRSPLILCFLLINQREHTNSTICFGWISGINLLNPYINVNIPMPHQSPTILT